LGVAGRPEIVPSKPTRPINNRELVTRRLTRHAAVRERSSIGVNDMKALLADETSRA
jgi:hypothetical protein